MLSKKQLFTKGMVDVTPHMLSVIPFGIITGAIGIDGSINIIEKNYHKDTVKQLSDITKSVINTSKNQKLSDDLTLISIGK